mmetsp:Transcript_3496/g.12920  ORF Transcript_3496/g.12920 Transcript_3496/m.12920 type:complete len:338 (-) Transcript_3496:255-1268(-)
MMNTRGCPPRRDDGREPRARLSETGVLSVVTLLDTARPDNSDTGLPYKSSASSETLGETSPREVLGGVFDTPLLCEPDNDVCPCSVWENIASMSLTLGDTAGDSSARVCASFAATLRGRGFWDAICSGGTPWVAVATCGACCSSSVRSTTIAGGSSATSVAVSSATKSLQPSPPSTSRNPIRSTSRSRNGKRKVSRGGLRRSLWWSSSSDSCKRSPTLGVVAVFLFETEFLFSFTADFLSDSRNTSYAFSGSLCEDDAARSTMRSTTRDAACGSSLSRFCDVEAEFLSASFSTSSYVDIESVDPGSLPLCLRAMPRRRAVDPLPPDRCVDTPRWALP